MLLFAGMTGLLGSWNAARPLVDPTRRYSPSWLPAMVITALAPFWLLVHGVVLTVGLSADGWANWGGRIGVGLLLLSMMLLGWIVLRSALAVIELRKLIGGSVVGVSGRARLIGLPVPTPPGVSEQLGIEWRDGLTLDLTRPDDDRRSLPVLVYVHGGGWTSGDPQRQGRDMYHTLALDGWVTLAIRYPFTPDVSVEEQIETVKSAIRWARRGLGENGVDATHVAIAGGSAGGHLATMAALTAAEDSEGVAACIGLYAVYDMANRNGKRAPWAKIRNEVMLESVAEAPNRYDAVSPLTRIRDDSPPVLVVHGTRDTLVPIGEAEQFVSALEEAGRPVQFVAVLGAQHAFDALSTPATRAAAAVIRDWLRVTVLSEDPAGRR